MINTLSDLGQDNAADRFSFRKMKWVGGVLGGDSTKLVKLKNSSSLTIMHDGLCWFDGDTNRVSFRHNSNRTANFLFADGHCENLNISVLPLPDEPDATTRANKIKNKDNGVETLKPWPHPHWRIDQK